MSNTVTLIEVGPRDGLQNEALFVPTLKKIECINQLSESGLKHIEVTSFVSPKSIPQLADHDMVCQNILKSSDIAYYGLVPNLQGMTHALASGLRHIAIFTAASESFNQRNIHCSIAESIKRFLPVIQLARQHNVYVRAYISCALGCPYEGHISPEQVIAVIHQLNALGVDEISLGDTIGVGTPKQTKELLCAVQSNHPLSTIAMHFHDTYGQAIANIYAALECGVRRFDSALAGLGGCPYARGASGNVATEDVLYLMHGLQLETGIDIYKIVQIGQELCRYLNRPNQSKVACALLGQC